MWVVVFCGVVLTAMWLCFVVLTLLHTQNTRVSFWDDETRNVRIIRGDGEEARCCL